MIGPGVLLAIALMAVLGLTHLARPTVWRDAIAGWAGQGIPGVVQYGTMHALPGALMIALTVPPKDIAEIIVLVLGSILLVKGTVVIFLGELSARYLLRMAGRNILGWRLSGLFGLILVVVLFLTSEGLL